MISTRKASGWALASFALIAASAQFAASQQRYSVTDEDAMGPGSPRVVVLHDRTAGAEAAIAPSEGDTAATAATTAAPEKHRRQPKTSGAGAGAGRLGQPLGRPLLIAADGPPFGTIFRSSGVGQCS